MSIGIDLVHLPAFAQQLEVSGSQLLVPGVVFTNRELRRARARSELKGDSLAGHLGAIWSLKEAVIKAWGSAVEDKGRPLPLKQEEVQWAQLQIHHSPAGAPLLRVVGDMSIAMVASLGENLRWQLSASHDGEYAIGMAFLDC